MSMASKNTIFYIVLAAVIATVSYFVISNTFSNTYNLGLSLSYNRNPGQMFPYNTTNFIINVSNKGDKYLHGMLLNFYINGVPYQTYNVSIPPKTFMPIRVNYTYVRNGTYVFEAVADPSHILSFSNSSTIYANASITVLNATPSGPFSSIPNDGVNSSQSLYFSGGSLFSATLLKSSYNISIVSEIFSPSRSLLVPIITNLYKTFNSSYGAFVSYKNGSEAQAIWIQGLPNLPIILQIVRSFGAHESAMNKPSNGRMFTFGGNTSVCVSTSGGWTKIVSYIGGSDCSAITSNTYNQTEIDKVSNLLSNKTRLLNQTDNFIYTNSTVFATTINRAENNLSVTKWFENNYGLFVSRLISGINGTLNTDPKPTCYGLISNNICSSYILKTANSTMLNGYALVLSEEMTSNYTAELYSLFNSTNMAESNYNAANLITALNLSGTPIIWQSLFGNSCGFNSTAMSCNVISFDSGTHKAFLQIHNNASDAIRLNYGSCFMPGLQVNETMNQTIAANTSADLNLTCRLIPIPVIGFQYGYNLYLNYTKNGVTQGILGFLNTSNLV